MTYHAMFSLYIMTGLLALVISVSLFCKSIAEAKEWKKEKRLFALRLENSSMARRMQPTLSVYQMVS